MRHIKDIREIIAEVRRRVIMTMVERDMKEIVICPDEETYKKEHENDAYAEDYDSYRCSNTPCVTFYDKYGNGRDYDVMKVTLCIDFLDDPHFEVECSENGLPNETFSEYYLTHMENVYEVLEERLGIDKEEIWVLYVESLYDFELMLRNIRVFKNEGEARKAFKESVEKTRASALERGYEVGVDDGDNFEAYPDGSWGTSHEIIELSNIGFSE